jgi:hypothetical protein
MCYSSSEQVKGKGGVVETKGTQMKKAKARKPYVQEPLFPELLRYCCYICSKWIDGEGTYIGQGKWRHRRCRPLPLVGGE